MSDHWQTLPDYRVHPNLLASALANTPWHVSRSRIADARAKYAVDGSGVPCAVGDTGFDKAHVELGNLPDKVFDFTPDGPYDGHSHGSHVGGDWLSMSPNAALASYKCLNDSGAGDDRWIARAIAAARSDGCWVFNGSFGSSMPGPHSLPEIERAAADGMILIFAGGNTGRQNDVQHPARSEYGFAVSPLDRNDKPAAFASTGKEIDVGYYGVEILSFGLRGSHVVMSGSSMAAPIFAGLLTLRLQWEVRVYGSRQTKTPADVQAWLRSCCRDAGTAGVDPVFGFGIPDAMEAFKHLGPPPVNPPAPEEPEEFEFPLPGGFVVHMPARAGDEMSIGRK